MGSGEKYESGSNIGKVAKDFFESGKKGYPSRQTI